MTHRISYWQYTSIAHCQGKGHSTPILTFLVSYSGEIFQIRISLRVDLSFYYAPNFN